MSPTLATRLSLPFISRATKLLTNCLLDFSTCVSYKYQNMWIFPAPDFSQQHRDSLSDSKQTVTTLKPHQVLRLESLKDTYFMPLKYYSNLHSCPVFVQAFMNPFKQRSLWNKTWTILNPLFKSFVFLIRWPIQASQRTEEKTSFPFQAYRNKK